MPDPPPASKARRWTWTPAPPVVVGGEVGQQGQGGDASDQPVPAGHVRLRRTARLRDVMLSCSPAR